MALKLFYSSRGVYGASRGFSVRVSLQRISPRSSWAQHSQDRSSQPGGRHPFPTDVKSTCRFVRVDTYAWQLCYDHLEELSTCLCRYVCYPFSITFELFTFCKIKCVVCLELNCAWSVWKIYVSDLWFSLSENHVHGKCSYWHGGALCVTPRKGTTADTGSGREQIGGEETFQGGWKKFCFFEERKEWLEVRARTNHVRVD